MTDYETKSTGISTIGLLGILFVTLKLCGVIDWSWWLVTAPFWGPAAAVTLIFIIALIFLAIAKLGIYLIERYEQNRKLRNSKSKL